MYLVLSPLDSKLSSGIEEVLLISPTVLPFSQRQSIFCKGFSIIDNKEVSFDKEELGFINGAILDLYRRMMRAIALSLNNYNNTVFSQKFWNIAVGRRVYDMICRYYISYRQIRNAIEGHDNLYTTVLAKSNPSFDRDYMSFTNNQYIIYSDLIKGMFSVIEINVCDRTLSELDEVFESYIRMSNKKVEPSINPSHPINRFERLKHSLFLKLYQANNNTEIVLDTPYIEDLERLVRVSRFRIKGCYDMFSLAQERIEPYKNYSEEFGIIDLDFNPKNEFESIIKGSVIKWIPAYFSEFFVEAEQLIDPLYSECNAKVVGSANSYYYNDIYNLWSAHMSERGAKVIAMDHGGTVVVDYNSEHECETYDYFYRYGKLNDSPRHTNIINGVCNTHLKANELFVCKRKDSSTRIRILLLEDLGYNPSPYCLRRGEEMGIPEAIRQRFGFIETIGNDDCCNLMIRAIGQVDHYESSDKYANKYSNVDRHVMTDVNFYDAVRGSDICVCDAVNGTPWQELIALDKPVILLMYKNGQVFTDYGSDIIRRMMEEKLVFEDGFLLAKYIETIADPEDWWRDVKRHFLSKSFAIIICICQARKLRKIIIDI